MRITRLVTGHSIEQNRAKIAATGRDPMEVRYVIPTHEHGDHAHGAYLWRVVSGAEVIAGALRDNQRAVLIGETTFGKGAVNHLRELSDGGALYITIARWLTPGGEQIEGIGLSPDVEVVPTEEDIEERRDVQLFSAVEYLRESMQAAVP